jgi:hypothetical protein
MLANIRERHLAPPVEKGAFPEVDAVQGIVRRVKILGTSSRDGYRIYPAEMLARCASKFEGKPCNINHLVSKSDPLSEPKFREYEERFGWFENVQADETGLYADLRFNPCHSAAPSFVWWCKNNPHAVGFSQDSVVLYTEPPQPNKPRVVQEILRVIGIDLVSDPYSTEGIADATPINSYPAQTQGKAMDALLDPTTPSTTDVDNGPITIADYAAKIGELTAMVMGNHELDEVQQSKAIKALQTFMSVMKGEPEEQKKEPEKDSDPSESKEEKTQDALNVYLLQKIAALEESIKAGRVETVTDATPTPAPSTRPVSGNREPIGPTPTNKPKEFPALDKLWEEAIAKVR